MKEIIEEVKTYRKKPVRMNEIDDTTPEFKYC